MSNEISFLLMQILALIDETGSVSKTAVALELTQSAVSKALSRAEAALDLRLVQRESRPLRLTLEGQLIADSAKPIDLSLKELHERLIQLHDGHAGLVRVGSFGPTASTKILPQLCARFSKKYPSIIIQIEESADQQTHKDLVDGRVDVAVLADVSDEFDLITLAEDHLVAVINRSSDLAKQPNISPKDLSTSPFIMTLAGSEPAILHWFRQAGHVPDIRHRVQQINSILALVKANMGHAIVTSNSLPENLDGVCIRPLAPSFPRDIYLVKKPGMSRSKAVDFFWEFASRVS